MIRRDIRRRFHNLYERIRKKMIHIHAWAAAIWLICAAICGAVFMISGWSSGCGWNAGRSREEIARGQEAYFQFRREMAQQRQASWEGALEVAASREAEKRVEESIAARDWVPELGGEQKRILQLIANACADGQFDEAARLMLQYSDELWELYYDTMESTAYLYRDDQLVKMIEGSGLVLKGHSKVFWGMFTDGGPDGDCIALQVIKLDYPRYDYAIGSWKDGKLNGEGTIGYHYYEGAGEENVQVYREGIFTDNLMNGSVLYSTTNAQGETVTWNMNTENGKLVLDNDWFYDEAENVYRLLSNQNDGHAYAVTEDAAGETRFQNLILWE